MVARCPIRSWVGVYLARLRMWDGGREGANGDEAEKRICGCGPEIDLVLE